VIVDSCTRAVVEIIVIASPAKTVKERRPPDGPSLFCLAFALVELEVAANQIYSAEFGDKGTLPLPPARQSS
jgi:hypothetical protein